MPRYKKNTTTRDRILTRKAVKDLKKEARERIENNVEKLRWEGVKITPILMRQQFYRQNRLPHVVNDVIEEFAVIEGSSEKVKKLSIRQEEKLNKEIDKSYENYFRGKVRNEFASIYLLMTNQPKKYRSNLQERESKFLKRNKLLQKELLKDFNELHYYNQILVEPKNK